MIRILQQLLEFSERTVVIEYTVCGTLRLIENRSLLLKIIWLLKVV